MNHLSQICPVPEFPRFRALSDAEERSMDAAIAEQAAQVEAVADAVRARITDLDLGDIACNDDLADLVRAGRIDDAGREFSRLVAAYCTECGEYSAGVV